MSSSYDDGTENFLKTIGFMLKLCSFLMKCWLITNIWMYYLKISREPRLSSSNNSDTNLN